MSFLQNKKLQYITFQVFYYLQVTLTKCELRQSVPLHTIFILKYGTRYHLVKCYPPHLHIISK